MLDLRQVFSLTDFLRNHKEHVARLVSTRKPVVLTVKGKPALVIQDAELERQSGPQDQFPQPRYDLAIVHIAIRSVEVGSVDVVSSDRVGG